MSETRSDRPVSIVLSGIGGMGAFFLRELLDRVPEGRFRIAGAVDPAPERCPYLSELAALGVPIVPDLEMFYARGAADFAIISSPHHFHAEQTCTALAHGSDVLCEKPAAASSADIRRMIRARDASGRWVAVGYQWSFSDAIQGLKADILAGRFGRPIRLKCLYLWPRDHAYYSRNDWAGRKRSASGALLLDSPVNNAVAHDLHNIFYVLGSSVPTSAAPAMVQGEVRRANAIEYYDTAALRSRTEEGAEVLLWTSHACRTDSGPVVRYEFERGTVAVEGRGAPIVGRFADGAEREYGNPDAAPMKKLWDCLALVGRRESPVCGLEAAASQTLCVEGLQESAAEITNFPPRRLRRADETGWERTWVEGLDEELRQCFDRDALPSELGLDWRPGRVVDLGGRMGP